MQHISETNELRGCVLNAALGVEVLGREATSTAAGVSAPLVALALSLLVAGGTRVENMRFFS